METISDMVELYTLKWHSILTIPLSKTANPIGMELLSMLLKAVQSPTQYSVAVCLKMETQLKFILAET